MAGRAAVLLLLLCAGARAALDVDARLADYEADLAEKTERLGDDDTALDAQP